MLSPPSIKHRLNLDYIASVLEGLEESIIYKLLDRAQFKQDRKAYLPGESGFGYGAKESLFEIRLRNQEIVDALFGRYLVPEERPFTASLPCPLRKARLSPSPLCIQEYNDVNLTAEIRSFYCNLLTHLCEAGDDLQYGSCTEHDVIAVQAISRRIHFGAMFVAESKYRGNPNAYSQAILAGDEAGLGRMLTRPEVEERILSRVVLKVESLQKEINRNVRRTIEPAVIQNLYRDAIIPLTKRGEIIYLLQRDPET